MMPASANDRSAFRIAGHPVPLSMIGALKPADRRGDLMAILDARGYLLLRGLVDPDAVMAARREVLATLASVGEIAEPSYRAVPTGLSRRADMHPDLGAFWKRISENAIVRRAVHGPEIRALMNTLFGEPADPFDFVWLRAMAPGRASPLHMDHPYMNRGTDRLVTCWTPLGPVTQEEAALYVIERSHTFYNVRAQVEGLDVDRDKTRRGSLSDDPIELARKHRSRLLTHSFEPGDVLIFGMFLIHASFDNCSIAGRVRLSCDTRWQPANEPMDERFRGPNPPAHGGKGYGCLTSAQPLAAGQA